MDPLTRDQILAADDLRTGYVDVPEWGGRVRVRGVPVASVDYIRFVEAPLRDDDGNILVDNTGHPLPVPRDERAKRTTIAGVIKGAIDEDGNRLFRWEDATALRTKQYQACLKVAAKAFELAIPADDAPGDIEAGKDS